MGTPGRKCLSPEQTLLKLGPPAALSISILEQILASQLFREETGTVSESVKTPWVPLQEIDRCHSHFPKYVLNETCLSSLLSPVQSSVFLPRNSVFSLCHPEIRDT